MIPDSFIEELKYRIDAETLVSPYTRLRRTGRTLTGLCPFHSEKSPSFVVYPDTNSFYCFGCGKGGDMITFVKEAEHLEYIEALKFLADRAGIKMPEDSGDDAASRRRQQMQAINRDAARFFYSALVSPAGKRAMDYLQNRGMTIETIKKFGLGYAPGGFTLRDYLRKKGYTDEEMLDAAVVRRNEKGYVYDLFRDRVMFPIIDLRGTVIGFGGRILGDGKPKYLNSPDTFIFKKSRGLFAMNIAKSTKETRLMLCEGYMDAISVHQAGFDNAVATLGTALTSEQARLISQYVGEVIVAYDSDEPGQKATRRATQLLSEAGVKVRVLTLTGAKDPDEFIKKYGAGKFKQLIEGSANSTEYEINRLKERYNIESDDGKVGFMREFCALMAKIPNKIEADVYITRITRELSVSREATVEQVNSLRRRNQRREEKKFDDSLRIFSQDVPNQQRDVQRSSNLRYALAEDKLIALVMRNPDFGVKVAEAISPEEFVTDSNRVIYSAIYDRIISGRHFDAMSLSSELDSVSMGRISYLMASNREQAYTYDDAKDLISVIQEKQKEKTSEQIASMSEEELRSFIGGIAAGKKQGGV
ncbi:MAG: DNA primase [Oscillospiraceae bacterium]|nr:DNA primase [Oscillospiraceae bacterium]